MGKARTSRWWRAKLSGEKAGELLLYGDVGDGWWSENSSKGFVSDVKGLGDIDELSIRINSIGGDVFAGMAIYHFLKGHKARKTVHVDGIAASIASVVAMAGDRIVCPSNATMMIHNPWGASIGDGDEMRRTAEVLDMLRGQIAEVYSSRTGLEAGEVLELMDAETWMTGTEAVERGFADEESAPVMVAASVDRGFFSLAAGGGVMEVPEERLKGFKRDVAALFPVAAARVLKEEVEGMTREEFMDQHPEVYAAVLEEGRESGFKAGTEQERARLQGLDELLQPGCEEIIARAKYEDFATAQDCAIELLKAQRAQAALGARRDDAAALNAIGGLEPAGLPGQEDRERSAFLDLVRSVSPSARAAARVNARGVN